MADNQTKPVVQQKSPTELLEMQAQALADLYQLQLKQQERIDQLCLWQKAVHESLNEIVFRVSKPPYTVSVSDVNMPFFSLVGFIVKVTLAAIPAYIILGIMIAIALAVLGGCSAFLGSIR